jgi:hypothetical protein
MYYGMGLVEYVPSRNATILVPQPIVLVRGYRVLPGSIPEHKPIFLGLVFHHQWFIHISHVWSPPSNHISSVISTIDSHITVCDLHHRITYHHVWSPLSIHISSVCSPPLISHIKCDLHHRFTYQGWSPPSIHISPCVISTINSHITMCDLHRRFTYQVCVLHHRFHISSVISTIDSHIKCGGHTKTGTTRRAGRRPTNT